MKKLWVSIGMIKHVVTVYDFSHMFIKHIFFLLPNLVKSTLGISYFDT